MPHKDFTNPFYFFILALPIGISQGFISVTLPYLLIHNGFTVAAASGIVAIGISANVWRFVWGPLADSTLSLRKWYWIGILLSIVSLLILCLVPYQTKGMVMLTVIVFISQVAATFIMLPLGGFMAHRVEDKRKGRAAGWYQAGILAGMGLGGGAGLWLSTHFSIPIAGIVLSAAMLFFGFLIVQVKDVFRNKERTVLHEMKMIGKDILGMLRVPIVVFVMVLIILPIGTGAAANVWSAVAGDWKVDADTVALVTGVFSALLSTIGCVAGGWIADRFGVWWAYLGSGTICALATLCMALSPYYPNVYIVGVLAYAFSLGLINAAFSSVLLFATGRRSAATKYSLLSSLGNIPVVYMTSFDGWAHDHGGSKYMLLTEAAVGIGFVFISILALQWMKKRKWVHKPEDAAL